jgi:antitoxin component of RelBE/YafQ-DinJ toxin-antitoxin module
MTVLFRCRIDKRLLNRANEVTRTLGTSTPEMFRIFVSEIARTGKVPVTLGARAEESLAGSWERRAATLESFYDHAKAW